MDPMDPYGSILMRAASFLAASLAVGPVGLAGLEYVPAPIQGIGVRENTRKFNNFANVFLFLGGMQIVENLHTGSRNISSCRGAHSEKFCVLTCLKCFRHFRRRQQHLDDDHHEDPK